MPLDKLIDLLAEAAVLRLSQKREQKDATPDAIRRLWQRWMKKEQRNALSPQRFAYPIRLPLMHCRKDAL